MERSSELFTSDIEGSLADIRQRIDALDLATLAYGALGVTNGYYYLAVIEGENTIMIRRRYRTEDPPTEIVQAVGKFTSDNNIKIVALAILSRRSERALGARLWLEEDIVPYFMPVTPVDEQTVRGAALHTCNRFDEHGLIKVPIISHQEVQVAKLARLDDYQRVMTDGVWGALQELTKQFVDHQTPLVYIGSTPQGGGVALMRHALIRFFRELGVPAHWHVMQPNNDVFEVTKGKFHNVLQGVAPEDTQLTEHDADIYLSWIGENAAILDEALSSTSLVVLDDPQPAGLIPHIRRINPATNIIYRSHIHLDRRQLAEAHSAQHRTWQFLWQFIQAADLFVGHPVETFIPEEAKAMAVTMPATTDPLDGLNKPLSGTQMAYYFKLFNKIVLEHDQQPLDDERPYIIQVARFDPSKGIPDVIEAYRLLVAQIKAKQPVPQLVLVGHSSVDDPDGVPVYNMTLHLLQSDRYRHLVSDVKVVRLHHNDQILNALLRGSRIALQLSHREGFEIKVSEALRQGKPVVAYRSGGIPLQIDDGETGYLVEVGDCQAVADRLVELFTDEERYRHMSEQAAKQVNPQHFTAYNAMKWLYLANQLLGNELNKPDGQSVTELLEADGYL
jgi:alpha,alpha-trehalose phosphorylase (configuration-retaining)